MAGRQPKLAPPYAQWGRLCCRATQGGAHSIGAMQQLMLRCLAGEMTPCVLAFPFPHPGHFICSFLNPCGDQLVCSISTALLV